LELRAITGLLFGRAHLLRFCWFGVAKTEPSQSLALLAARAGNGGRQGLKIAKANLVGGKINP
jgi:hypothetical protein